MPIPAPAVVELLRGAPLFSRNTPMELVTPTGAAILAATVEGFGAIPPIRVDAVGYGAGHRAARVPQRACACSSGESEPAADRRGRDDASPTSSILETNVDDLNPELYAYVLERLLAAGAQDAWLTPIVMKKGRPAVTISVLCAPERADALRQVLFRESGTLGVRTQSRAEDGAGTRVDGGARPAHGRVRVKVGRLEGRVVTVAPEFEDCVAVAREADVPARDVYEEAGTPRARGRARCCAS